MARTAHKLEVRLQQVDREIAFLSVIVQCCASLRYIEERLRLL